MPSVFLSSSVMLRTSLSESFESTNTIWVLVMPNSSFSLVFATTFAMSLGRLREIS